MRTKIFVFAIFFLVSFILGAKADTVCLNNGRKMEGKIKKRNEESVWLDIGAGSVKFNWEQIDSIQILNPDGTIKEIKQGETIEPEGGADSKLILDREAPREILAKTEAFSVSYPSDWKEETNREGLILKGPLLSGTLRPYIFIREEKDESLLRSMEKIKETYYRWKDLPVIKDKMLEFIMPIYEATHDLDKYKFVSCDYEEKGDFIIQRLISLDKTRNGKICDTSFITITRPTRGYSLIFFSPEEDYDEYFPIFEKCMDSFSLKE